MPRRGFTLIELLVVIGILAVLMGLLIPAIAMVRKSAANAKCTGMLGSVASAIEQYRTLNGSYPEFWLKPSNVADAGRKAVETALAGSTEADFVASQTLFSGIVDGKEVFNEVFSTKPAVPGSPTKSATDKDLDWNIINALLTMQLGSLASDHAKNGLLIDPWGRPLRYRPSKWYPFADGAGARIDGSDPPRQDSFQLWSSGIDKADDAQSPGEGGDDLPFWAKKI